MDVPPDLIHLLSATFPTNGATVGEQAGPRARGVHSPLGAHAAALQAD
jgi:hypothetical protein